MRNETRKAAGICKSPALTAIGLYAEGDDKFELGNLVIINAN